jgi:nucleoside-triphosphatase THEP1
VIILDEIGKMECFSGVFRKAAVNALILRISSSARSPLADDFIPG